MTAKRVRIPLRTDSRGRVWRDCRDGISRSVRRTHPTRAQRRQNQIALARYMAEHFGSPAQFVAMPVAEFMRRKRIAPDLGLPFPSTRSTLEVTVTPRYATSYVRARCCGNCQHWDRRLVAIEGRDPMGCGGFVTAPCRIDRMGPNGEGRRIADIRGTECPHFVMLESAAK